MEITLSLALILVIAIPLDLGAAYGQKSIN